MLRVKKVSILLEKCKEKYPTDRMIRADRGNKEGQLSLDLKIEKEAARLTLGRGAFRAHCTALLNVPMWKLCDILLRRSQGDLEAWFTGWRLGEMKGVGTIPGTDLEGGDAI